MAGFNETIRENRRKQRAVVLSHIKNIKAIKRHCMRINRVIMPQKSREMSAKIAECVKQQVIKSRKAMVKQKAKNRLIVRNHEERVRCSRGRPV
jgi:hypothetical protein